MQYNHKKNTKWPQGHRETIKKCKITAKRQKGPFTPLCSGAHLSSILESPFQHSLSFHLTFCSIVPLDIRLSLLHTCCCLKKIFKQKQLVCKPTKEVVRQKNSFVYNFFHLKTFPAFMLGDGNYTTASKLKELEWSTFYLPPAQAATVIVPLCHLVLKAKGK